MIWLTAFFLFWGILTLHYKVFQTHWMVMALTANTTGGNNNVMSCDYTRAYVVAWPLAVSWTGFFICLYFLFN